MIYSHKGEDHVILDRRARYRRIIYYYYDWRLDRKWISCRGGPGNHRIFLHRDGV